MTRVIRIVLIITFIILLAFWFSGIFKSCGAGKDKAVDEATTEMVDSSTVFDEFGEDFLDEGLSETGMGSQAGGTEQKVETAYTDAELESFTDYTGTDIPKSKSTATGSSARSGNVVATDGGGNYLVVAGSFLVEANAVELKDKLVKLGYNAEVRNFDYSQYHSVIAGRYQSQSEANSAAARIKAAGHDCYVKKREL